MEPVRAGLDAGQLGNGGEVDDLGRVRHALALNPVLHDAAEQIAAARNYFCRRA